MAFGFSKTSKRPVNSASPKVELEPRLACDSQNDLDSKIEELTLKLTIANEALKAESDRCQLAQKALEESENKHRQLRAEYHELILKMQRQMEQVQEIEEVGKILTPALAHDLKSLLAAISSLAQLSIEKSQLPSPLSKI